MRKYKMARDNYIDAQVTPYFKKAQFRDKDLVSFCVTCYSRDLCEAHGLPARDTIIMCLILVSRESSRTAHSCCYFQICDSQFNKKTFYQKRVGIAAISIS